MKEQSHKDEMAAAVRSDFARLKARGVMTTLAPHATPAPEAPTTVPTLVQEPAPVPGVLSWLDRLLGR